MCGICGIVKFNHLPVSPTEIKSMMNKIKHRGPDDEGLYLDSNIGFGFVRLSILDLSVAGHQPMFDESARYMIIYNGEVFNYIELRTELKQKGYKFRSNTDTEVVLNSYIEWGAKCLDKFNGMWAFVIYDKKMKKLFIARDRYGIKPLYFYQDKEKFFFASEIKALIDDIGKIGINQRMVFDFLIYNRTDHTDSTFFEEVKKIPKGCYCEIQNNKIQFKKWYDLTSKISYSQSNYKDYLELLTSSVSLRLRSDVDLGVFLSGGLDSSSIVSLLQKKFQMNNFHTFSAVYPHDQNDEGKFIDLYRDSLHNMHFISPTAESFWNDYKKFILVHSEPTGDTGPYIQYKVMELASKYVKVTLSGQGADEQLGGYHDFFGSYYVELIKNFRLLLFIKENYKYFTIHRSFDALKYFGYYISPNIIKNYVNRNLYGGVSREYYNDNINESSLDKELYSPQNLLNASISYFTNKLEHLLKWEDINSMAFSIESRVPFLDHKVVEFSLALPSNQIINNGMTKIVLRKTMEQILPEKIRTRTDKKGFSNPRENWFRDKRFIALVEDILNSQVFLNFGYFDKEKCISKLQNHILGHQDNSKDIWKWINLYYWNEFYIKHGNL